MGRRTPTAPPASDGRVRWGADWLREDERCDTAGGRRGGVLDFATRAGAGDAPLPGPAASEVELVPSAKLLLVGIPDTAKMVFPNNMWALGERTDPPGLIADSPEAAAAWYGGGAGMELIFGGDGRGVTLAGDCGTIGAEAGWPSSGVITIAVAPFT